MFSAVHTDVQQHDFLSMALAGGARILKATRSCMAVDPFLTELFAERRNVWTWVEHQLD